MAVLRITPNLLCDDPARMAAFYRDLFGLDIAMALDFITTTAATAHQQVPQISMATEGGSGTELPVLSIEVDDLDALHDTMRAQEIPCAYGPVNEPWGVRRLFLRDPAGHLINVLEHRN
ncbi:VOC family protein [Pseudooceanicola sp.]|uniref:VOC family protein n=1 Tax=Pseudooceanicola sp. TaxID=1914328 RepID=UPI004059D3E0